MKYPPQQDQCLLDFSKSRLDERALTELRELADCWHPRAWMDKMTSASVINHTEKHAV